MNCDQALEAVSAAADGELADDGLDQLDEHLAICQRCREFDRSVHRIRSHLRFEPVTAPPGTGGMPDVVPVLRARIADLEAARTTDAEPTSAGESTRSEAARTTGPETAKEAGPAPARGDSGRQTQPEAIVIGGRSPSPRARSGDHYRLGLEDAEPLRSRMPHVRVAAVAAVVGMIAGATFAGLGRDPQPPAAANLGELVLTAQHEVTSVDARFQLTEGSDGRSFDGELTYEAPESLELRLTETSATTDLADGDVRLMVDQDRWSLDTVRSCASCPTNLTAWHQLVTGREPFSDAASVPLELVTAVDSFALTGPLPQIGSRAIAGRDAIGVSVPAAQLADFLSALSPADDLRPVHPTDQADVWLDQDYLVPLLVNVRAGDGPGRDQWAASQGYADPAGASLLRYSVHTIAINDHPGADSSGTNEPVTDSSGTADAATATGTDTSTATDTATGTDTSTDPATDTGSDPSTGTGAADATPVTERRDDGFRVDDARVVPEPAALPDGLRPYVSGTVDTADGPRVAIRSWTDGRAWVKVRATDEWAEARLFGGAGLAVRAVDLGTAGVGYLSADARTVAMHTDGLDLVVTGSLPGLELRAIAASLGVLGLPIPADWPEAATATIADAQAALPQVLVAHERDGFAVPAIRVAGDVVIQVYAGPGDRGFVLTQSPLRKLSPPADEDSLSVSVRGEQGRYSVGRGELEWVTGDGSHSLASPTMSMGELAAVAERLGPP